MKSTIQKTLAIAGLVLILAGAGAKAQSGSKMRVSIPFDFTAGGAKLKAGVYSVRRLSDKSLSIRKIDGTRTALLNAPLSLGARDSAEGRRLIFNKYGEQYFLSQVWLEEDSGRQLFTNADEIRAAREFRLASKNSAPERVAIAFHN